MDAPSHPSQAAVSISKIPSYSADGSSLQHIISLTAIQAAARISPSRIPCLQHSILPSGWGSISCPGGLQTGYEIAGERQQLMKQDSQDSRPAVRAGLNSNTCQDQAKRRSWAKLKQECSTSLSSPGRLQQWLPSEPQSTSTGSTHHKDPTAAHLASVSSSGAIGSGSKPALNLPDIPHNRSRKSLLAATAAAASPRQRRVASLNSSWPTGSTTSNKGSEQQQRHNSIAALPKLHARRSHPSPQQQCEQQPQQQPEKQQQLEVEHLTMRQEALQRLKFKICLAHIPKMTLSKQSETSPAANTTPVTAAAPAPATEGMPGCNTMMSEEPNTLQMEDSLPSHHSAHLAVPEVVGSGRDNCMQHASEASTTPC